MAPAPSKPQARARAIKSPGPGAPTTKAPAGAPQVCALVAEEAFLLAEAVADFRRVNHAPPPGDLNAERFDLAKDTLEQLLEAVRTLPMLAPRRFVQGDNLEGLPASQHRALLAYLEAPNPRCTLLLTASKLDGRQKLTQALRAQGALVVVEVPKPRDAVGWTVRRARAAGVQLGPATAAALVARTGPNFGVVASALEVLALHAGSSGQVDEADVAALVAPTREAHVFELTAALGRRAWPQCSRLIGELLGGGQSPLMVLAMVTRQLRLLLAAKRWHGSAGGLAEAAGVRPFVAEAAMQDARRTTERTLLHGLRAAQVCDLTLKTGTLAPHLALERLLLAATGGQVRPG